MSNVTGRRLNYFYQKAIKPLVEKLENVLSADDMDDHIFNEEESGFVPKTRYSYNNGDRRFLCADGTWKAPEDVMFDGYRYSLIASRNRTTIDGSEAATTEDIWVSGIKDIYYGGILLLSVCQVKNIGSFIGVRVVMASYAYSIAFGALDAEHYGTKIAALSGALSSTYGTITVVNESSTQVRPVIRIKAAKGYQIDAKIIS